MDSQKLSMVKKSLFVLLNYASEYFCSKFIT